MPRDAAIELVEYLSNRAGSHLRACAYYDETDYSILYLKDELDQQYTERELEKIADHMRQKVRRSRAERLFKMGEFRCSLLGYEDGLVLHFPQGGSKGTIITLEAAAASNFNTFTSEFAERIYDN